MVYGCTIAKWIGCVGLLDWAKAAQMLRAPAVSYRDNSTIRNLAAEPVDVDDFSRARGGARSG